jgi:hypothetical protein
MLKRLLSTVATFAFLLGGATVAMEALGLIFHVGPADPRQRAEAAIARIEANADPMDVPREPEAERLWPLPEEPPAEPKPAPKAAALVPPPDAGLLDGEKPTAVVAVSAEWTVRIVAETEVETKALSASPAALRPPVVIAAQIKTTLPAAAAKTEHCAGECVAVPRSPRKGRSTGAEHRRAPSPINCPLLEWLAIGPAT